MLCRIPQAPSPSSQQESVPVAARSAADAASELLRAWDSALAPAMQIAAEEAGWQVVIKHSCLVHIF